MKSMAGTKDLLKTPSNFQSSAMFEGSECVEVEGVSVDSTVASSVSACKKVLCGNSLLDSPDFWLKNEKTLCRLGLTEEDSECTMICFVNVDSKKTNCREEQNLKKLSSVSPDLPRLVEVLTAQQPKNNELLLLDGLEAQQQQQKTTGVCLLQCSRQKSRSEPANIILEINKFLMGLQWGRERQPRQQQQQHQQGRPVQRAEDDTNRSISSIEDDFQTASEHLGEDSEDDGFRNECESGDLAEAVAEGAQKHCTRLCQRGPSAQHPPTSEAKMDAGQRASLQTKESAGHYATNLAESVLQDAFIRLSQDESSFVSEAAVSVSRSTPATQQRTCSFELPKIVIVQSPDNSEGPGEWSESQSSNVADTEESEMSENETPVHIAHHCSAHASKHVEVALACAANVIGTITSPQVTERIAMESEDDNEEDLHEAEEEVDYSVPSAMCGMAQVAGAVAAVELTEETGESVESDAESMDVYTPSRGLMSAAEASAAFTLHCSVAEGTSVEAFRANIAEVLHREAAEVLTQPQGYKSVAHLLETTHYKIVDGITCSKKCTDEREVDDMINEVADSLFKHALEKARKKKELEGCGKEVPSFQHFLQESVNNLLFDILCITQKKISHVSRGDQSSSDFQGDENNFPDTAANRNGRFHCLINSNQSANCENRAMQHSVNKVTIISKERHLSEDRTHTSPPAQREQAILRQNLSKCASMPAKEFSDHYSSQQNPTRDPLGEIPVHCTERRGRLGTSSDSRQSSLTPQSSLNSCSSLVSLKMDTDSKTPITCYAEDLASTVVSMATELAAICLENSTGKQPWFCALKGATTDGTEAYLIPACRTVLRRKDVPGSNGASKKHRAPRLSEIKRKTEEQPELMERLVNRVVDETVHPDETQDPFALFASEVTARIMNCPELNVVDTSKAGQPRSRLQCERWSRGKASSYESIPEEDSDPSGTANTLGPGSRLGQNLSRGSSISKQSSCESITDEFSRFMVNQMETEGRGFDLLLDYYAGKNASSILAAAVQQAATKKNGHLNVRTTSCLSKQSSTESITEEFYRFMLRDMDKENKEYGIAKTKEWSNSLFPPSPRTPFCIRQSSVPDRRSSDSRLTVNSPIKANSFDGFARNVHGDTLNIYPSNSVSVSATGLCKSDSCLYQRGKTDQITDMLIHETWSSSIESLMRKNKIIADPEDSIDLEASADSQPHVQQFANRLAADIVDIGKSALGGQQDTNGAISQPHMPVGERRRGFKQSHLSCSRSKSSQEQTGNGLGSKDGALPRVRASPRDVPLIHIEGDQKVEDSLPQAGPKETTVEASAPKRTERVNSNSSERDRASVGRRDRRSLSASSEESMGSWSHMSPEEDPPEESSSFIHLSEGNGTSSASSLGLTDLDTFSEVATQSTVISEETERTRAAAAAAAVVRTVSEISVPVKPAGGSSTNPRELQVLNFDLDSESRDWELRVALQWIAASELGLSALYFRRSRERREAKFQRVVLLMTQKSWRVGDLFRAVLQFCERKNEREEEEEEEGKGPGLFDWILQTL